MLPYSATDMLNVMRHEQMTDDQRRYGDHIARDVERDDDRHDDSHRQGGLRARSLRLSFLRGVAFARGA